MEQKCLGEESAGLGHSSAPLSSLVLPVVHYSHLFPVHGMGRSSGDEQMAGGGRPLPICCLR